MAQARRALLAGLALSALGAALWIGRAVGTPLPDAGLPVDPTAPGDAIVPGDAGVAPDPLRAAVATGREIRIEGHRGPIRVWIPASYHADTAATIVYVHGFHDTVDTAWVNHRLPEQFALAAANALIIAPEAPSKKGVPINYPDLGELIRIVEDATGVMRGSAYTAAIGHSGAIKTLYEWLDEPMLDALVLVDALYLDESPAVAWLAGSPRRRLVTVGEDTILASEDAADEIAGTVRLDRFPPSWSLWPAEARTARHLYIRAQYTHMGLVTNGLVLPALVRLLPVELLADEPWQAPLGSLSVPDAVPDAAPDAVPAAPHAASHAASAK